MFVFIIRTFLVNAKILLAFSFIFSCRYTLGCYDVTVIKNNPNTPFLHEK